MKIKVLCIALLLGLGLHAWAEDVLPAGGTDVLAGDAAASFALVGSEIAKGTFENEQRVQPDPFFLDVKFNDDKATLPAV